MPKSAIYTPVEPPVEVRKPGGTPYNCLYGEDLPQRGTLSADEQILISLFTLKTANVQNSGKN